MPSRVFNQNDSSGKKNDNFLTQSLVDRVYYTPTSNYQRDNEN